MTEILKNQHGSLKRWILPAMALASGALSAAETVVYDARTPQSAVTATGNVFSVGGNWDFSEHGENFQIGWGDICDDPYPETIAAVRWVGDNMYRIRNESKVRQR